jgi:NAD(P)-dependent dehydrogenase (short-subunit alcohol dehydrogenase family)
MARVFITGSADGLGRLAAETLLHAGHEVVVHVRSTERLVGSTSSSAMARPSS